ncbi:hypothetical protein VNO80_29975 [Phaseolus coccineus]|uniref:Uncharacterized protein n=1 Tax=Phaseolus coccineus TaxID=3886 RepID=A0AAN9LBX9_PHACN
MERLKEELAKSRSSLQEALNANTLLGNKVKTLKDEHSCCDPVKQALSKKVARLIAKQKRLHILIDQGDFDVEWEVSSHEGNSNEDEGVPSSNVGSGDIDGIGNENVIPLEYGLFVFLSAMSDF